MGNFLTGVTLAGTTTYVIVEEQKKPTYVRLQEFARPPTTAPALLSTAFGVYLGSRIAVNRSQAEYLTAMGLGGFILNGAYQSLIDDFDLGPELDPNVSVISSKSYASGDPNSPLTGWDIDNSTYYPQKTAAQEDADKATAQKLSTVQNWSIDTGNATDGLFGDDGTVPPQPTIPNIGIPGAGMLPMYG